MSDGAAPRKPRVTAVRREEARRLFETSDLSQAEIARRIDVAPSSLGRMAHTFGWERPGDARRLVSVRRIRARVEEQIGAVEAVLAKVGGAESVEAADKAARTLSSLVRLLRELQKYDAEQAQERAQAEDADEPPADLDALRDALAERLARLRRADS